MRIEACCGSFDTAWNAGLERGFPHLRLQPSRMLVAHRLRAGWPASIANPHARKVTAVNKVRALDAHSKTAAALDTPSDLSAQAVQQISAKLNAILATTFALYLKTKNFHWHVSGPHFRDYHLLLDEQGEQIFDSTDDIAERARKIGGTTLRSIGQVAKLQGIEDNDKDYVSPVDMLRELMADNKAVVKAMRECHELCDQHDDVATASLLENFIDQAERRTWFLFEASRSADGSGH
jgi:starvation-inducible DNA-binding protein